MYASDKTIAPKPILLWGMASHHAKKNLKWKYAQAVNLYLSMHNLFPIFRYLVWKYYQKNLSYKIWP